MSVDNKTVYVTGIKYTTTRQQVEEAFSQIGPVRSCFLVQPARDQHHKGCGFVQFAIKEDAERALKDLNGSFVDGRRVQVEQARRRDSLEVRKQRKRPAQEAAEVSQAGDEPLETGKSQKRLKTTSATGSEKQALLRTVAVGGVLQDRMQAVKELAETAGKVEVLQSTVPDNTAKQLKLDRDGCPDPIILIQYSQIKEALHAVTVLHGHVLPGAGGDSSKLWARQAAGEGAYIKKWRLILRNLAFQAKETDLRSLLKPAGFLWELNIPLTAEGKRRGFAFATMTCPADAQRVIQLANGKTLQGRVLAVDWAVPKSKFQLNGSLPAGGDQAIGQEKDDCPVTEQDKEVGASQQEQPDKERTMLQSVVNQLAGSDDEDDSVDPKQLAQHSTAKEPDLGQKAKATKAAKPAKGQDAEVKSSDNLSSTVFVRSLPLDVTQPQLHASLAAFGPVKSCRLVRNKANGKLKGTAFVEFREAAAAGAAVQACAAARDGKGAAVTVQGTALELSLALSQTDARNLAAGLAESAPSDNRNLYLAKEGAIEEGSQAWQALSAGDRTRRKQAAQDKAVKLRSPNFFVSRTRLSLRSLPRIVDEAALQALLQEAVRARAVKAAPRLKQVKILRDPDKPDKDGKPTSKGMGFAEFESHEHALCALRQLNNNPSVFGEARRPIVEFALENSQTLKRRQEKQDRMKRSRVSEAQEGPETAHESKRQKRQPAHAPRQAEAASASGAKNQQKHGTALRKGKPRSAVEDVGGRREGKARQQQDGHQRRAAAQQQPAGKPRKKSSRQDRDALDELANKYKSRLFGSAGKQQDAHSIQAMKRWFD
ncbi:hypothetical protein WJX73_000419 [Symbiochloris irregularis]|uniref:RRM domain-containing protein n=1 Tax=Symbiochloris irregularis TaxID=706552 RepID=A0AAW1P558_9CHLO